MYRGCDKELEMEKEIKGERERNGESKRVIALVAYQSS